MLLAIEGGGTKTRLLLADGAGAVVARETGGPASPLYIERDTYVPEIRGLLGRIKKVAERYREPVTAAGIAGPMDRALIEQLVGEVFGPIKVLAAGECDIAFAVYGLTWGVSLIAGTGASCRALNQDGQSVSHGGFGPQFGDEGSGYWIGRSAISAALRAGDGRGPHTALTDKICAAFGLERPWDIFKLVDRSGHVSGTKIATLVPLVFATARDGDAVALAICRDAGCELGKLIIATARTIKWRSQPVPLVLSGGVFHGGGLIIEPIKQALSDNPVRFDIFPAITEPTEGIIKWLVARD